MDISKGYLRLFRKMLDWEWYDKPNTKAIFIHCLLCANQTEKEWQGIKIKKGQFITSLEKLAMANGLTIRQTRTALNDIVKTGEIDKQTTNRYSIITVKNYNMYQANDKQKTSFSDKQTTSKLTGKRQQLIRNSNTSYINISSSIEEEPKITEEEEEILKNYSKGANRKIRSYVQWRKKILLNGDYIKILEEEKKKKARKEQMKKQEILKQVQNDSTINEEEQEKIREIQKKIRKGMKK